MFSTTKSVYDYTGIDLDRIFASNPYRARLIARLRASDPEIEVEVSDIDIAFEGAAFLRRAQSIIEIYIGKDEIDIDNPADLIILDKMTAYQAVYMLENEEIVFQQAAITSQGQTDFVINFDGGMSSPWIAPLAVMAARGLSFKKSRSFRTGKIFQFPKITKWRNV